jgi:hypothetical protein
MIDLVPHPLTLTRTFVILHTGREWEILRINVVFFTAPRERGPRWSP